MKMQANTYLISVRPTWADAFFLDRNPKTIELRKGNFGASLKPGDSIIIYATLPFSKALGTVKVIKREPLAVDGLWKESQQGILARVSRAQFDAYGSEPGIGYWSLGGSCRTLAFVLTHAGRLRQKFGQRWLPPQQIQQLNDGQISALTTTEC
jgi:predicted transcriptional regulator